MITGFACGVFDLYHAGHVRMLKECKDHCDYLIVAVNSAERIDPVVNPGKNLPVYSLAERVEILQSVKFVDEVLIYRNEQELREILASRRIDIRFLGADYKGKPITGGELNIPVHYTDRSHGLSTSAYLKLIRGKDQ